MSEETPLFDRLTWQDPVSGKRLEPVITARTPSGVPICGALRVEGTDTGYPIVDCVVRATPELAHQYADWLAVVGLRPVQAAGPSFQDAITVDSFGFQWGWNAEARTDADLKQRVATKYDLNMDAIGGRFVLDAGAGAGDQSRYLLQHGARVVSADLSSAIEVVSRKLRHSRDWVGIQGDVMRLPLAPEQFDHVYCEGVIQHTADSAATVRELKRVARIGGTLHTAHYVWIEPKTMLRRLKRRFTAGLHNAIRNRLSRMERYKLLLFSGNLAALSHMPLLGWFLRKAALTPVNPDMPDLRTTWTNTYDKWGGHAYQRYVSPEEYWGYFQKAGDLEPLKREAGVIVARRVR
jgi:ubiquinone/menaquinone biosynthesis C-methylase UbiE